MKNLIILSGEACAGKTTVGEALAGRLGYRFLSVGGHIREFARERYQLEIHAFQNLCAANPEIDRQLDHYFCQKIQEILDQGVGMVVDFRMGAHFFPAAMSIYLQVSPGIVRQRLAGRKGEDFASLSMRNAQSRSRLLEIYGYDYVAESNYRHVIDTDSLTSAQIVGQIVRLREGRSVDSLG
jgi:cytidylate kinase